MDKMTMPMVTSADELAWFRRALELPEKATYLECVVAIRKLQLAGSVKPERPEMTAKFNERREGPEYPEPGEIARDIFNLCESYSRILSKDRYGLKTESDVEKLLAKFRALQGRIEEIATALKATGRYTVGVGLGFKND